MVAALGTAIALSGCANVDVDSQQAWFRKPFQVVSPSGGYTFSELQETKQQQRPITANDLVNSNGSCPPPAAPVVAHVATGPTIQPVPAPPPATAAPVAAHVATGPGIQPVPAPPPAAGAPLAIGPGIQPVAAPPPAAGAPVATGPGIQPVPAPAPTDSLLGGGVALGMSECDIVFRAGAPTAVQLGRSPNGDRTATLTFNDGPRPGIYRFERGALVEMDRVQQPEAQPLIAQKKPAKPAKSAKSNKPQKKNDQT
jgi:hypothetical protein